MTPRGPLPIDELKAADADLKPFQQRTDRAVVEAMFDRAHPQRGGHRMTMNHERRKCRDGNAGPQRRAVEEHDAHRDARRWPNQRHRVVGHVNRARDLAA